MPTIKTMKAALDVAQHPDSVHCLYGGKRIYWGRHFDIEAARQQERVNKIKLAIVAAELEQYEENKNYKMVAL